MTPTQEFLDRNPGLMAEVIADYQQRKKMVDMAKTKDPVDANVVDNPNLRALIPYPRLLYNHSRRTMMLVNTAAEHEQSLVNGWKNEPWPGATDGGTPVGPGATSDPMTDERMDSIEQRMLSLEQMMGEILSQLEKRKPGRPPNNPQA